MTTSIRRHSANSTHVRTRTSASKIALLAASISCLSAAGLAQAQDQTAEADDTDVSVQDTVIVTATKRAQALEEVPLAVTVVGQQELNERGIQDITTLERAAPSYTINTSDTASGGLTLRLRGVGTTGNNIGLESSVGAFIDGFYLPRPGGRWATSMTLSKSSF